MFASAVFALHSLFAVEYYTERSFILSGHRGYGKEIQGPRWYGGIFVEMVTLPLEWSPECISDRVKRFETVILVHYRWL